MSAIGLFSLSTIEPLAFTCAVSFASTGLRFAFLVALTSALLSPTSDAAKLSTQNSHACAVSSTGIAKCWGWNAYGQVGNSTWDDQLTAVSVSGLSAGVRAITVGPFHSCAVTVSGAAMCWGLGDFGMLGNNSAAQQSAPVSVSGLSSGVAAIEAGDFHTCALTSGGAVRCWGSNLLGSVGNNSTIDQWAPVSVSGLSSGVTAIAIGGGSFTCALTNAGAVRCWGQNDRGQTGNNGTTTQYTPVSVSGLSSGVTAIAAGRDHACALIAGGGVKCWGSNEFGELGNSNTVTQRTPVSVIGLPGGVVSIAAGGYHTCALTAAGAVYCWGSGYQGQLGNNSTSDHFAPTLVSGLPNNIVEIAAGETQTCIRTSEGAVQCWGSGFRGRLGNNSTQSSSMPVSVWGFGAEQTVPSPKGLGVPCPSAANSPICTSSKTNAVLITHGWNANGFDWVFEMAQAICKRIGATQTYGNFQVDGVFPVCSGSSSDGGWDVWIADWTTLAIAGLLPQQVWMNASVVGSQVATYFSNNHKQYKHYHLIAHSAGSHLIDKAASRLTSSGATVHETFLDPYDPSAFANPTFAGRHVGSSYGKNATWAENYVDTRLVGVALTNTDFTDLRLGYGFNVNVTPTHDGCEDTFTISSICSHSRPYRFYGMSIDSLFVGDASFKAADPITTATGGLGFVLSAESGVDIKTMRSRYPNGGECSTNSVCLPSGSSIVSQILLSSIGGKVIDTIAGTATFVEGVGTTLYSTIKLGVGLIVKDGQSQPSAFANAVLPTESPSWAVVLATTTLPVNTLRFSWRFASAGQGILRIFVNGDLVREIDQRYVPLASSVIEEIYIGGVSGALSTGTLPAGTHRISFRLDGFGASASGVELSSVDLGMVAVVQTLTTSRAGNGSGTITSSPAGIDCGAVCTGSFSAGSTVSLNAAAASGSTFVGWSGACSGTGTSCTITMDAAKTVTATFNAGTTFDANVRSVVSGYYQTILGRAADQAGLDFWATEAARVKGLGADVREVFFAMSMAFFSSSEYLGKNTSDTQFITDLYRTFFNRTPDASGLAYWLGELAGSGSRSAFLNSFLFSAEFSNQMTALFGASGVRPEITLTIDLFRGVFGRLPDSAGFTYWLGRIRTAQCQGAAAVAAEVNNIAGQFFNSSEYLARGRSNRDFVGDVYNAYLRRGPGGDAAGFNYWVGQVPTLGRDGVRAQFVPSAEFQSRVTSVVNAGCVQ